MNSKIVKTVDSLDKRWSAKIHNLDLPKFLQVYIAFFALVCNKEGPVMLQFITSLIFPHFQTPMQPYYFIYYWSQYLAMGMTAFITTVMLKKHFKRPRPVPKNLPKRLFNIRG